MLVGPVLPSLTGGVCWWRTSVPSKELKEKVSRLCSSRSNEKELDRTISKQKSELPAVPEELVLIRLGNGGSFNAEGWELVTSCTRRLIPAPSVELQLQIMFSVLAAVEGLGAVSNKVIKPTVPEPCSSTRKTWKVILVGSSCCRDKYPTR